MAGCLLAASSAVFWAYAMAETAVARDQLLGTWMLVSATADQGGSARDLFGPSPRGMVTFSADGFYSLIVMRTDLPKIMSNNREMGTVDENKAIASGSLAHFGRYTIDEANRTIRFEIEASSFPNWNGAKQLRPMTTLTADDLAWTNPTSSQGATSAYLAWKRAR